MGAYKVDPRGAGRVAAGADPARFATTPPAERRSTEGHPDDMLPGGAGPCHIQLDATGSVLLCANYEAGNVAALPVADAATGALAPPSVVSHGPGGAEAGKVGSRQDRAHPHGVFVDP